MASDLSGTSKTFDPGKSRPPLSRMLIIHNLLLSNKFPNRRNLSERFGVSQKTVERDIAFMRDQLELPIEYDSSKYGFIYTGKVTQFPGLQITEREFLALYLLHRASASASAGPLQESAESALRKLSASVNNGVAEHTAHRVSETFSFSAIGKPNIDREVFEAVSQATIESHELEFSYTKIQATKAESRKVRPYHLTEVGGQWYLHAFDIGKNEMRIFALTRVKNPRIRDESFIKPPEFSMKELLKDSFGVMTNSGRYQVRLWFDNVGAVLASERQWHPSQQITQLPDGEIQMEMILGSLTEVRKWLLGFGKHARVLGPQKLIDRMRDDVIALAKYYPKNVKAS